MMKTRMRESNASTKAQHKSRHKYGDRVHSYNTIYNIYSEYDAILLIIRPDSPTCNKR